MRSVQLRSRTLVYGFDMTPAPAHTTCTRNTERCHGLRRSMLCIKIWLPDTVLVSGQFMYVFETMACSLSHRLIKISLQVLKVVEIEKTDDVKRPYIKQLLTKNLKFPLPHRVAKTNSKSKLFAAHRPSTFA